MAITRKNFNTSAVLKNIYPMVDHAMKTRMAKWKACMAQFMQKRANMLFDTMPCDRITFTDQDRNDFFAALNIDPLKVVEGLSEAYFWKIEEFRPKAAKDPLSVVSMCIIRYFLLAKDQKNLDLAMIYNAFSGKYYPSIHYNFFRLTTPAKYRHIMEYVVNNMLTQKFELKAAGSVIGAIKITNNTWVKSYEKMLKSFDDEDFTYIMQQLHNRIKSFMKNISNVYYKAYQNKDYITYDKDSLPEEEGVGDYHLTSNDTFRLQQYVEKTMEKLNTSQVDYKICKMCADANIKTEEVRGILESILNNRENTTLIKEYLTKIMATYMAQATGTKDIVSVNFYKFCTSIKPNTKDENLLRAKAIIEELLDSNSVSYRKRKHRVATKASYHKAFSSYFAITAINANK